MSEWSADVEAAVAYNKEQTQRSLEVTADIIKHLTHNSNWIPPEYKSGRKLCMATKITNRNIYFRRIQPFPCYAQDISLKLGILRPPSTLKMEAVCSSETLVSTLQITRRMGSESIFHRLSQNIHDMEKNCL
jgi:hypothetical protein